MRLWPWDTRTYIAAFVVQGTQPLTEDLYRQEGKQNPGEPGYGAKPTSASMGTSAGRNHRSRTGRPVIVRAAASVQVTSYMMNVPLLAVC